MKDVAKRADVSIATVSNIINNTSSVKEETRERVFKAIKELSYQVDPTARKLRTGQSNIVAFMVSNLSNYFYQELGFSIERCLKKYGYHLFYINSNEDPLLEIENLKLCIEEGFAGIIITPVNKDWNKLNRLVINTPIVFLDRKPLNISRDFVLSANTKDSFIITNEMIKRGAQKLAFLAPSVDGTIDRRLQGFKDAIMQNQLEIDEDCIKLLDTAPTLYGDLEIYAKWYKIVDYLIDEKHIDCILSGSGILTYAIFNHCMNRGLTLQKDLFFASYDSAAWMKQTKQNIIAIAQSTFEMGEKSADLLVKRIKQEPFPFQEYLIDGKLLFI